MSAVKVAAVAVGGLLVLGAAGGGLTRDGSGAVDPKASITNSFDIGAGRVGGAVGSGLDTAAEAAGRGALSAVEQTVEASAVLSAPGDALGAVQSGVASVTIDPARGVVHAATGIVSSPPPDPSMVAPHGSGGGGW